MLSSIGERFDPNGGPRQKNVYPLLPPEGRVRAPPCPPHQGTLRELAHDPTAGPCTLPWAFSAPNSALATIDIR